LPSVLNSADVIRAKVPADDTETRPTAIVQRDDLLCDDVDLFGGHLSVSLSVLPAVPAGAGFMVTGSVMRQQGIAPL
jgi:hypothetical protein